MNDTTDKSSLNDFLGISGKRDATVGKMLSKLRPVDVEFNQLKLNLPDQHHLYIDMAIGQNCWANTGCCTQAR
jgi:hypothetical protein